MRDAGKPLGKLVAVFGPRIAIALPRPERGQQENTSKHWMLSWGRPSEFVQRLFWLKDVKGECVEVCIDGCVRFKPEWCRETSANFA